MEGGTHHISIQMHLMRFKTEVERAAKALKLRESRYHLSIV